ncbi:hypothetical protein [Metabacillus arenae]|uniref:Uncharacterized protein n=1 Tax=Metabacillus arenae TaxID=2771434 RepID=A0A926RWF7_9BACI|nr:hypothetical protein [Metabacillus arenae]MBD1379127.1 hypothetical protein [Metabacillus arenae]
MKTTVEYLKMPKELLSDLSLVDQSEICNEVIMVNNKIGCLVGVSDSWYTWCSTWDEFDKYLLNKIINSGDDENVSE